MITDKDASDLREEVKDLDGFIAVGIGADELIIYTTNTKHDFPKAWNGHPVRATKTSKPRPAHT